MVNKRNAPIPEHINKITGEIVDAAYVVHSTFGPGLLENIYELLLVHELRFRGLNVQSQVALPIEFKGLRVERGLVLDILVENCVVAEVKSVKVLHDVHSQQLLTYLKVSEKRVGLLINFNAGLIKDGIKRVVL